MLCQYCQSITIEGLVGNHEERKSHDYAGMDHQPSFSALVESARSCGLCQLFHRSMSLTYSPQTRTGIASHQLKLRAAHYGNPWSASRDGFSNLRIRAVNLQNKDMEYFGTLDVFAKEGSPPNISRIVDGRPISVYPTSNETLNMFRLWIRDCRENHPLCARPVNFSESGEPAHFPMPTKLLDVSSRDSTVKLVVSDSIARPYVALSHRWAKLEDHVACTTTRNLSEKMNGIPYTNLSPLFCDAVEITQLLGIKYLWIDSLCIIQDDAAEWSREAARMADIFEHAELVISALRSDDGFSTFLGPRDQHAVEIPFRKRDTEKAQGGISLRLGPLAGREIDLRRSALSRRGWIFQERILPRRVLSFSNKTTYFECQSLMRDECTTHPWPSRLGGDSRLLIDHLENASIDSNDPKNREPAFWYWRLIISQLSVLELTYEKDRLLAFQGVAKRMERAVKSTYAHGLWIEDIIMELSWYISSRKEDMNSKSGHPQSPRRIPSWSWAASRGQKIDFHDCEWISPGQVSHSSRLSSPRISWDEGHELKLESPMKTCILSQTPAARGDFRHAGYDLRNFWIDFGPPKNRLEDISGQVIGSVALDKNFPFDDIYQAILLYTNTRSDKSDGDLNIGLLLHAIEGHESTFERIGLACFHSGHFFDDADRVIVTLI